MSEKQKLFDSQRQALVKVIRQAVENADSSLMIETMSTVYAKIDELCDREYNKDGPKSEMLWELRKATKLTETENQKVEIAVEKRIVQLGGPECFNQVPAASGWYTLQKDGKDNPAGGKASVDLARKLTEGEYELIELKVNSSAGDVYFATAELLTYAFCYLFVRKTWGDCNRELLRADKIHLVVWAPKEYFQGFDSNTAIDVVGTSLNQLIEELGVDVTMTVEYRILPLDPPTLDAAFALDEEAVQKLLAESRPVSA